MKRTYVLALFAAFCLAGAPMAMAAGPKTSPQAHKAGAGKHGPKGTAGHAKGRSGDKQARHDQTVASKISKNPQQKARLEAMLPAGMTLEQASSGFRNQGQFIAALNASKEHNIAFADLKNAMTGDQPLSLGQAIQKLKPTTSSSTP